MGSLKDCINYRSYHSQSWRPSVYSNTTAYASKFYLIIMLINC